MRARTRTRIAVAGPLSIATAMRRPCDAQPSMYTGCISYSELQAAFRTNGNLRM
jgi:hypothetical protein